MLLDGEPGRHQLLLTVRRPGDEGPIAHVPVPFEWPAGDLSITLPFDLDMGLPGAGLYEFHILIDGEPITIIPWRVIGELDRIDIPS